MIILKILLAAPSDVCRVSEGATSGGWIIERCSGGCHTTTHTVVFHHPASGPVDTGAQRIACCRHRVKTGRTLIRITGMVPPLIAKAVTEAQHHIAVRIEGKTG